MDNAVFLQVALNSDKLRLYGEIVAYKRDAVTYQLNRSKEYQLPESSYEVEVDNLLQQLGVSTPVTHKEMEDHHISIGCDGKSYICCFYMSDENLVATIKLWLAHQLLHVYEDKDIAKTGDKPEDVILRYGAEVTIDKLKR